MSSRAGLLEVHARARQAWPQLSLPEDEFIEHLQELYAAMTPERLSSLHASDLGLAYGCLTSQPAAIEALEEQVMARLELALEGFKQDRDFVDEVLQHTRNVLLLGPPPARPKLASYRGGGTLVSWASVLTVRLALKRLRQQPDHELLDEESWASTLAVVDTADAELELLKHQYRDTFAASLREGCKRLESRERALLHLYFVGEMTLDKLGSIYGVHSATISRRLATARQHLAEQTKQVLMDKLAIDSREFVSIERLVRSQLDLSLGEFFLNSVND
ncbi:MAG: sigma-70 family RNA polymerase sigma factor [Myxococcota bacterium]